MVDAPKPARLRPTLYFRAGGGGVRPQSVVLVTHTGEVGGAEAALLRLIDVVDRRRFRLSAVLFSSGTLAEELAARGVPVTLLEGGGVERVTRSQAGNPRSVLGKAVPALRLARRLRAHLAGGDADLVVANSLKAAVLCSVTVPLARRRWVWHLHDRLSSDYLPRPVVAFLRAIARWGPRAVIANSDATALTAGRTRSMVVAFPGVPSALFDLPVLPEPNPAVGIVGRISATKGQRQFLEAIEALGEARLEATFRIVGAALFEDAAEEKQIRRIAAHSELLHDVEWTGWTDDPVGEIRRLRLLVHASPVPEPFGQVVVEAMAVGTPVVATDAGGVPEILAPSGERVEIADGVSLVAYGILVRPGDSDALAAAIRWTMSDGAVEERTRAARASARERFTIELTRAVVEKTWAAHGRR